jgi:RNA-directed DNA polymerase
MSKQKTLHEEISSPENLRNAWNKLNKTNENSVGLSGKTLKQFSDNLEDKILAISIKLQKNQFKFSPTRAVTIPKDNGKYRPLQVPEIEDRLVLKSIAISLEQELSTILDAGKGVSFAYQKKIGIRDAVEALKKLYKQGNTVILEADIINFFGEVNKKDLLKIKVFPNLRDDTINSLIEEALNQKVGGIDKIKPKLRSLFSSSGLIWLN